MKIAKRPLNGPYCATQAELYRLVSSYLLELPLHDAPPNTQNSEQLG